MLTENDIVMLRLHSVALAAGKPHFSDTMDELLDNAEAIFEYVTGADTALEDEMVEPAGPGPFYGPSLDQMGVGQGAFPQTDEGYVNYADDTPSIYAVPPCDFPNCGCAAPGDCPATNAAAGPKVDYVDTVEFDRPERLDFASAIKRYHAEKAMDAETRQREAIIAQMFSAQPSFVIEVGVDGIARAYVEASEFSSADLCSSAANRTKRGGRARWSMVPLLLSRPSE
jgi:hypothetical protein